MKRGQYMECCFLRSWFRIVGQFDYGVLEFNKSQKNSFLVNILGQA